MGKNKIGVDRVKLRSIFKACALPCHVANFLALVTLVRVTIEILLHYAATATAALAAPAVKTATGSSATGTTAAVAAVEVVTEVE